jgi:hypothetical protein
LLRMEGFHNYSETQEDTYVYLRSYRPLDVEQKSQAKDG